MSRHKPEDFLARFDQLEEQDLAVRAGNVMVGGTTYMIQPWREDTSTCPCNWFFNVKIFIEHLPLHAWNMEGVKQALGDVCIFDHMDDETYTHENTDVFGCYVSMFNPDHLSRKKSMIFFLERPGRSSTTGAPPEPTEEPFQSQGGEADLLFHIDHYYDWTPIQSHTPSSGVCGLLSSDSSGRQLFPPFRRLNWHRGGCLMAAKLQHEHRECWTLVVACSWQRATTIMIMMMVPNAAVHRAVTAAAFFKCSGG